MQSGDVSSCLESFPGRKGGAACGDFCPDPQCARVTVAQRSSEWKIESALFYMLQNLDTPLEMGAVSRRAGTSISTFYHLFKRVTGVTPNAFFIRARMRRACQLLREPGLSVKEVAARLGYSDQFYFSRIFKSVVGVSPRAFRAGGPAKAV